MKKPLVLSIVFLFAIWISLLPLLMPEEKGHKTVEEQLNDTIPNLHVDTAKVVSLIRLK